jgi:hypothetical protein
MSATSELAHLFRAMKAPAAAKALPKLADRARAEEWSYERFAEALLSTETSARDAHGGDARIRGARFPARKTLEEFDFTFQRSIKKQVIEHLGQLDFLHGKENVVLLGRPGQARRTSRSPWGSGRAWPANASCFAQPPSGSLCWLTPSARAAWRTSSNAWNESRC